MHGEGERLHGCGAQCLSPCSLAAFVTRMQSHTLGESSQPHAPGDFTSGGETAVASLHGEAAPSSVRVFPSPPKMFVSFFGSFICIEFHFC